MENDDKKYQPTVRSDSDYVDMQSVTKVIKQSLKSDKIKIF